MITEETYINEDPTLSCIKEVSIIMKETSKENIVISRGTISKEP
jgi:hypothetical protein